MLSITEKIFRIFNNDEERFPRVLGRLIYHSYYSYGDGSSNLYILNFETGSIICISDKWTNVIDPMNAVWSDDGKRIVFMAIDKFNDSWELYSYTIGEEGNPTNLTNNSNSRDEDPKFYPGSNDRIIFKSTHDGMYHIKTIDINTKDINTIYSSYSMECSMPYYSYDGLNIYFSGLENNEANIYEIPSLGGIPKKVLGCSDAGINEYYPVTKDETGFYYTRPEPNDRIYFKNTKNNDIPIIMPFNDLSADNSDTCVVSHKYTIISRNNLGVYDLYICDNDSGDSWNLNSYNNAVNTSKNELGAAYTSILDIS